MFALRMYRKVFRSLAGLLPLGYLLSTMVASPGCANMSPPMGGPKDTLSPILLKASPENYQQHFTSKTVRLEFDEYVELGELQNELVVNPPYERIPDISVKLRTVTIKIKDTLQPNTTYSFYFGNAIKDLNEGNPIQNFEYVFSTGDYIDSLQLSGTIIDAQTGLPDSTMTLMLHVSNDDSAVAKQNPRYVAKPNGKGNFQFHHLAEGNYYLFAIKDEGQKKYTSNKTPFAFFDKPVAASISNEPFELRHFVGEVDEKKAAKPAEAVEAPGGNRKKTDAQAIRITSGANEDNPQDLLAPLRISFSRKIKSIDSSKLHFTDTNQVAIRNYTLQLDTSGKFANITTRWKDAGHYRMQIDKAFALDSAGVGNTRADTVFFKSKSESEYGSLKMQVNGLDMAKHPLLIWIREGRIVESMPLTNSKINIPLFQPGEYELRILYDTNQNGHWDTGDYWKKIQPEFVIAIEQKINIKANWENEFDINL
ncbi:MAG TPA: Ig-like domain-containing protein [Phnomibacter sp.]|nr:Ig-like domain-containing protein [Phnomibacter sp.]